MTLIYPDINGERPDFASLLIAVGGGLAPIPTTMVGVKSINYKEDLKSKPVMGTSPIMIGRTRGVYECDADMEIYRTEFDGLVAALLGPNAHGFGQVPFDITVSYRINSLDPLRTDTIAGCRIESVGKDNGGTEALTVKLKLNPFYLLNNGRMLTNGLDALLRSALSVAG